MRLPLQRALWLLALYVLAVALLAWWADAALDDAAATIMDESAHLVASEVASALDDQMIDELLAPASVTNRIDLLNQILDITKHSATVRFLEVVDGRGLVFASSDFVAVGRQTASPGELFGTHPTPRLLAEGGLARGARRYVLAVPLRRDGKLVGYLRLGLDSSRLARLYPSLRHRLFLGALGGLVLVGAISYGLHLQLRHRNAQLVAALERAAGGGEPSTAPRELAPVLAVAGRLGRELHQERRRSIEADRRLQRLAEMVDVGTAVLSADLEVEFSSERARTLLGLPPEPTAAAWRQALAPLEGILQNDVADRATGLPTEIEVSRWGKTHRVRCQVYPLDDERTAGYLVHLRDRELLQAIETDLRMAAQLRALTRVYRGVAHDLRAPLNAMVLNLELLRRSLDSMAMPGQDVAAKQQRWVAVIEQELQRLRRALDVLLAQTAPPSETAEPFDLRNVIEEIEALLYPQARQQQVTLDVLAPDDVVTVVAHRDQIKQSVLNIAINALEAMPAGGTLSMSLEREEASARVRVSDTGPGIPAELRDRIFDMHFTTKESGTGIGLYVARSMFEAQGGTVRAASSGPEGTTFELLLPLPGPGS